MTQADDDDDGTALSGSENATAGEEKARLPEAGRVVLSSLVRPGTDSLQNRLNDTVICKL